MYKKHREKQLRQWANFSEKCSKCVFVNTRKTRIKEKETRMHSAQCTSLSKNFIGEKQTFFLWNRKKLYKQELKKEIENLAGSRSEKTGVSCLIRLIDSEKDENKTKNILKRKIVKSNRKYNSIINRNDQTWNLYLYLLLIYRWQTQSAEPLNLISCEYS